MCRSPEVNRHAVTLPLHTFRSIAECLFATAAFVDLRGWGESTILPDFQDYLEVAHTYGARLKLITNAVMRRAAIWKKLAQYAVVVGISFDAATDDTFRLLRGNARMDRVIENIHTIAAEFRGRGLKPRDYLYFCITVSGANLDQLEGITRIGRDAGIHRFKLEPLWVDPGNALHLSHHREKIPAIMATLDRAAAEQDLCIELSAALSPDTIVTAATRKLCIHPWQYLYVSARGRLGFCDHLNGREEFTFADWSPDTFPAFWNGTIMQQLRREHTVKFSGGDDIALCVDCNWCYANRYMDLEDWIQPDWSAYRVSPARSLSENR